MAACRSRWTPAQPAITVARRLTRVIFGAHPLIILAMLAVRPRDNAQMAHLIAISPSWPIKLGVSADDGCDVQEARCSQICRILKPVCLCVSNRSIRIRSSSKQHSHRSRGQNRNDFKSKWKLAYAAAARHCKCSDSGIRGMLRCCCLISGGRQHASVGIFCC